MAIVSVWHKCYIVICYTCIAHTYHTYTHSGVEIAASLPSSVVRESHAGSLTFPVLGVFIPGKWANTTNRVCLDPTPGEAIVKLLAAPSPSYRGCLHGKGKRWEAENWKFYSVLPV